MTSSDATALSPEAIADGGPDAWASPTRARPGGQARVALVCAKFNGGITERLLDGALGG